MSAQELVSWLASLCFPDHCPLKQLAIVNGNLVDLLRHRLGERNGVNLTAIEFADAQKCTLMWRYVHPSSYSIGVDQSVASLVLGIRRQPNIAVIRDDTAELLATTPEVYARTGFIVCPEMLDPRVFEQALETAAANTFPGVPTEQRQRILYGTVLPNPIRSWLMTPDLRPIVLSSAPVQRIIHHFPPSMLHMRDGKPYEPKDFIIYRRGIYELLNFAEGKPETFRTLTYHVPFIIVNEDAENLCHICVLEAYDISKRFDSFSRIHNKAVVIMINPTHNSDLMCADKAKNDCGMVWCTHGDIQATQAIIVAASSSRAAPPPSAALGVRPEDAQHFNRLAAFMTAPLPAGAAFMGERALHSAQSRSAHFWPHELESLHQSARFSENGLAYARP
jgi:hypothetical protein